MDAHDERPTLNPLALPTIAVADDPECGATLHCWPVDFDYGDTCACGRFYLLRALDGAPRLEESKP